MIALAIDNLDCIFNTSVWQQPYPCRLRVLRVARNFPLASFRFLLLMHDVLLSPVPFHLQIAIIDISPFKLASESAQTTQDLAVLPSALVAASGPHRAVPHRVVGRVTREADDRARRGRPVSVRAAVSPDHELRELGHTWRGQSGRAAVQDVAPAVRGRRFGAGEDLRYAIPQARGHRTCSTSDKSFYF